MLDMHVKHSRIARLCFVGVALTASTGYAQAIPPLTGPLPGAADVGRLQPEETLTPPDRSHDKDIAIPSVAPNVAIPEAAKGLHFVLKGVHIEGATAFTPEQLSDIYAPYVDKDVSLEVAWIIAGQITERYRNAGYFLSRAFVPEQHIKNGKITLKVVEGYIGEVELPPSLAHSGVVRDFADRVTAQRPITTAVLESTLLRLNDLPGDSFRAVLSPMKDAQDEGEAAVKLTLVLTEKEGKGSITFDNYSSRYLGPHELSASYSKSILPLQQTSVSGVTSIPGNRMQYGTIDHSAVIAPDWTLDVNGGVTDAYPGYRLNDYEIDSKAISTGVSLNYQWERQREENLSFKLTFNTQDVSSDILGTPLTRDHIRALRLGASYDVSDAWKGYNTANLIVSQGLSVLSASHKDDLNLSRAGAEPDFTKLQLSLLRLQAITSDWSVMGSTSGQWASGILYSSEQFGYGGQSFGRAYDASDIIGDHGLEGTLEVRYGGFADLQPVSLQPYVFYDIGKVWSESPGQLPTSGSSAGIGMRFLTRWQQTGNLGVAWPLTRPINDPLYGESATSPRILFQIGQDF